MALRSARGTSAADEEHTRGPDPHTLTCRVFRNLRGALAIRITSNKCQPQRRSNIIMGGAAKWSGLKGYDKAVQRHIAIHEIYSLHRDAD